MIMKAARMIFLFLLPVISILPGVAQSSSDLKISPQNNEIISPTPSSAQQMRYQSPQPALATGAVNLSIPLYTIDIEGLKIPFTLNYHTSGIKPLDDPFPCGYGWSLLPGLKVTRTIRGRADEDYEYMGENPGDLATYASKGFAAMCNMSPGAISGENNQDRYDTEKDIFTISLPSGVYKRIIFKDVNNKYKWNFIGGGDDDEVVISGNGSLNEITAIDALGYIYKFGKQCEKYYSPYDSNALQTTAWMLSSIVLPSGREISFNWEQFNHDQISYFGGNAVRDSYNPPDAYVKFHQDWLDSYPGFGFVNEGYYRDRLHLSKVSTQNLYIELEYKDKKLSSFIVKNSAGDTVRTATLSYGTSEADSKFLQSVTVSGEGTYSFGYNHTRFDNNNHRQDWWGYYNGREPYFESQNTLTPRLSIKQYTNTGIVDGTFAPVGYADRRPDAEAMKAGILTVVYYPTGGRSEFEYEPHRFPKMRYPSLGNISDDTDPWIDMGGGLRVSKIVTRSGETGSTPITRTYSYDSIVVTSVPSASTFVTIANGIGAFPKDPYVVMQRLLYTFRMIHVANSSDYMKNRVGEETIWYPRVTEHYADGAIEYEHSVTLPRDIEHREWGHSHAVIMNNVLGKGVRLKRRRVLKNSNDGNLQPVLTEDYEYEKVNGSFIKADNQRSSYIINTRIERQVIQSAFNTLEAPDFTDGRYLMYQDWYIEKRTGGKIYYVIKDDMPTNYMNLFNGYDSPYRVESYSMYLQSDRLKSKSVTYHRDNGDFTQTETYEYKPGTSIVTSVVTTVTGDERTERVDLTYPSAAGTAVERAMVNANITALPLKSRHTFGTAVTEARREMKHYGNRVYRPAKVWLTRGGDTRLAGSYDYDTYGNMREYRGEDSVATSYLWGYGGIYPVYRIDGAGFAEIEALVQNVNALGGNADLADLTAKLEKPGQRHVTKALWKPLVGMTSLRQPCGLTESYEYDSAGRLILKSVDGHGPVEGYSYHVREGRQNYMTSSTYNSENSSATRLIVNYDGLGRETTRLTAAPDPDELFFEVIPWPKNEARAIPPLIKQGDFYATLTEYDAMDRPYRTWAPVYVDAKHPTANNIATAANELYGTEYAYTTTFYEASPLAVTTGSLKAGKEWHDADRRVTVRRLVNAASGDYACPEYEQSSTLLRRSRYYPASTLSVEEITDEEGHVTMTFTDRRGLTVMTREGETGDWHDTRYVYNDYGDLLFVIQPNFPASAGIKDCFRYEYDARGNRTLAAMPGGTETRYRYDTRNRLFAEQDGNMRDRGEWIVHHYDNLGRPAFSAVATATDSEIESAAARTLSFITPGMASFLYNNTGGYVCRTKYPLTITELVDAHYYDSYDFTIDLNEGWDDYYTPPPLYSRPRASAAGLDTGTAAGGWLETVFYDNAGRIVRRVSGDMKKTPDKETYLRYSYEGNLSGQLERTVAPQAVTLTSENTYWSSGHLKQAKITQNDSTALFVYSYDRAGRVDTIKVGDDVRRTFTYDVAGRLTASDATTSMRPAVLPQLPATAGTYTASAALPIIEKRRISFFSETIHYADAADGCTPRYDGRISGRKSSGYLMAYSYDIHGRLTASEPVPSGLSGSLVPPDIGTEYNYDRNANITSISRRGIIDIVGGKKVYGLHDALTMTYSGNRLMRMEIVSDGAEYEGRTGVSLSGVMTAFAYDSNGNMTADPSRGIARIRYDRLDKPVEVTFAGGHRQTVSYDGFGRKIRVDYAQGPASVIGGDLPADGDYELTSSRVYAGAHVFCDGRLEYSGFPGGYFDSSGSPRYYITDWQGNNAAVVDKAGNVVQKTTYYPYGEPTIEPEGQRYLFGGKEREHAGGRNSYDFGARSLTPYARWSTPDPLADKFYPISPYSYCGGDPINFFDPNGEEKRCLTTDPDLINYSEWWCPDNSNIIVIMHGYPTYVDDDRPDAPYKGQPISNAAAFQNLIWTEFETFDPAKNDLNLIELHSCHTGQTQENGSEPIAQTFSRGMPNSVIKAPNGSIVFTKKVNVIASEVSEAIPNSNNSLKRISFTRQTDQQWRYFFRGVEISSFLIPFIRIMLRFQNYNFLNKTIEEFFNLEKATDMEVNGIPYEQ